MSMTSEKPSVSPLGKYTIRQAAEKMGVCENTMYNWVNTGVFRTSEYNRRKVGRKELFITGMGLLRVWNATMC